MTGLSVAPGLPSFDWNLVSFDKAAHFGVYAILSWLICLGFQKNGKLSNRQFLIAFGFASGWGMLMEFVQGTFFPYRFFEWPDEVANAIGAALGVLSFVVWKNKKGATH